MSYGIYSSHLVVTFYQTLLLRRPFSMCDFVCMSHCMPVREISGLDLTRQFEETSHDNCRRPINQQWHQPVKVNYDPHYAAIYPFSQKIRVPPKSLGIGASSVRRGRK